MRKLLANLAKRAKELINEVNWLLPWRHEQNHNVVKIAQVFEIIGALERTRTPNLLIRSQVLYPIELRARGERVFSCMRAVLQGIVS